MEESRTNNSIRNSCIGIVSYAISAISAFILRTIFIRILGVEYLGVSSLYSNILSMLALSDLGIGTVMVFSLYKPLAERNTERITALVFYFRKLYNVIAGVIFVIGVLCIPILPYIISNSGLSHNKLVLYYLLLLVNSVCSYFAVSKTTLIRANQKMYLIQIVTAICTVIMNVCQIVILYTTKDYALYLAIQIIFTIITNLVLSKLAVVEYPYLNNRNKNENLSEIRNKIIINLKATFIYKIGATIMNSTDNILISILLGTVIVGYYSNYLTVVSIVNSIISILISSLLASIGNYYALKKPKENFELFKKLLIFFYALSAFCASCYYSIFTDFIIIWIGEKFVMSEEFLLALVINNYVNGISNPIWMTRESSGVFVSTKYVMLCAAILNIVISVILGKAFGVGGIIIATAISRLLSMFWYEPLQLSKRVFTTPVSQYWKCVCKLFITSLPVFCVGFILKAWIVSSIAFIIVKVMVCALVTVISFWVFLHNTSEWKSMQETAHVFLNKYRSHNSI